MERTDPKPLELQLSGPAFLSIMTTIYYSVLLLLTINLTIITIATQPVKEVASEGQPNPGGCISDWRGLKKAYLDHQSSADVENSIFDFYPSDAVNYGVLVMFYDVGPPPNTSTSGRRECCQQGSNDCIIHFIYKIFNLRDIHPELLRNFAFLTNVLPVRNMGNGLRPLCWAPPRFCEGTSAGLIIMEFSKQVLQVYYITNTVWKECSQCHNVMHVSLSCAVYGYCPSR